MTESEIKQEASAELSMIGLEDYAGEILSVFGYDEETLMMLEDYIYEM